MKTTRLQVTLDQMDPTVSRVLDVPAASTLPELHLLLQAGMGWTNSHLHRFETDSAAYGMADPDGPDDEQDQDGVPITALGASFSYWYDFGDDWQHSVTVLGPGGDQPGCVYGEGACPPEDCGGIGGYTELLAAFADPSDPEYEHLREWAGVLPEFSLERADRDVRGTAGAVPASVRLVLDMAVDGVKLTPGGRLNRAFVRRVQEQRPTWAYWDKPASVEEDLLPLTALHDLLRSVGLLRLQRGVVTPIRAAADDLEVVRRLRRGFDEKSFEGGIVGTAVGWLAANGPTAVPKLAEVAFDMLGRGWVTGDRQVVARDVENSLHGRGSLLEGLDLIIRGRHSEAWKPGPSAWSLLPRATGLAAYFEDVLRRYPDAGQMEL